jgi:hypothetical protein
LHLKKEGELILKNKRNSSDLAKQIANAGRPSKIDEFSSAKLQGIRRNKIKSLSLMELSLFSTI